MVPKPAVGENGDFHRGANSNAPARVFVGVTLVSEFVLQRNERRRAPMIGGQRKHNCGIPVGIKLSPVNGHENLFTLTYHVGNPVTTGALAGRPKRRST